jgi:hypothetical protein
MDHVEDTHTPQETSATPVLSVGFHPTVFPDQIQVAQYDVQTLDTFDQVLGLPVHGTSGGMIA